MHRRQGARERRGVDRDTEIQPSPPLQGDAYGEQIPRVVDETIAYLEHSCVSQPSLFFGEPSVREINDLIDAIRDAPTTPDLPTLSAHRPQLAAAALAAYVHSLPAPLVPSPAYERLCGALGADSYGARVAQVRDAIASLSEPNQAVLHRLFAFLAWLSKRSTAQGNDAARLADFWAPLLTPAAPYPKGRPQRTADYRITGLMLQQVACVFQGKPRTSLAQASHKPRTSLAQVSHKSRTSPSQVPPHPPPLLPHHQAISTRKSSKSCRCRPSSGSTLSSSGVARGSGSVSRAHCSPTSAGSSRSASRKTGGASTSQSSHRQP